MRIGFGINTTNPCIDVLVLKHPHTGYLNGQSIAIAPQLLGKGVPFIISVLFYNISGNIADRMIKGGMAVVKVRKIMQSVSLGGMAATMMVVGYAESVWVAIGIMTLGNILGSAAIGGFVVNHMDIAPKYAGTLMGITNTMAAIPGIIGVYAAGYILEATGSWVMVFQLAGAVSLFGMLFYLIFASADKQFD